jgi:hypothetical protein
VRGEGPSTPFVGFAAASAEHDLDVAEGRRCPRCGSSQPHLHPAVQFEGEVEVCPHAFHEQETPQNRPEFIAAVRAKRDATDPTNADRQRLYRARRKAEAEGKVEVIIGDDRFWVTPGAAAKIRKIAASGSDKPKRA